MPRLQRRLQALLASSLGALTLVACSGSGSDSGGGAGTAPGSDFAVVSSNVLNGSIWQLNRAIDVVFNEDVDFTTVSLSTIQIIDTQGVPAIGEFTASDSRTVRFQPVCPTNDLNSNGGLKQGREYNLRVVSDPNGVTVLSTSGAVLGVGLNISFSTPESSDPLVLFVDVVAGPPQVRVRGLNGEPLDSLSASAVEFGDGTTEYFQFNPVTQLGGISSTVPLNLYSNVDEQFSIVLRFNQPVFAGSSNVNSQLIEMQYSYNEVNWSRVPSTVALIDNCTQTGSSLQVTPGGVVPQDAFLRVVVREGFQDLTGDSVQATQTNFARMTSALANPGGSGGTEDDGSDEILVPFTLPGTSTGSLEDTAIASALPRAGWSAPNNEGVLAASFDFDGTGGPGGDFDWYIRTGETIFLNTSGDQIVGGPNGEPFFTQPVFNGVVDVNDLVVEDGGRLVIQGPNTCTILATGTVTIRGEVSLDGGDNAGVGTLNTTNQPEEGAQGQAGGGAGGPASFLTSQSTPRGGAGEGYFGIPNLGGGGGETTFAPPGTCSIENRRGAGGGGGTTGKDVRFDVQTGAPTGLIRCQTLVGMDGEPGFTGCPDSTGAVSGSGPAKGGDRGPSPFTDEREDNDFLGTLLTSSGEQILGELTGVIA
ncbi:MAG: Ig-like domain-containing protein, partial [Planctomycetota bacterium]|nr:Ig-like domain-containing protein [Planctomycetota bacterium]